jgi:hypothetical protein
MSITVNTDKESFISGAINGKAYNIPFDEGRYASLLELSKGCDDAAENCSTKAEYDEKTKAAYDTAEDIVTVDFKETVAASNPYLDYNPSTEEYYLKVGDKKSKHALPKKFVEIIEYSHEKGIDCMPVVNLCIRFLLNPFFTARKFRMLANEVTTTFTDKVEVERLMKEEGLSHEVATKRATYPDKEITKEGYLRTFKVVREIDYRWTLDLDENNKPKLDSNGKPIKKKVPRVETSYEIDEDTGEVKEVKDIPYLEDRLFEPAIRSRSNSEDFYSGDKLGWAYKIGKLHALPSWESVDVETEQKHVGGGLYTGGRGYVECYLGSENTLIDAFVCPSKIGKFTDNGTGEMVCLEMFIHDATTIEGNTKGLYNTSTYGKLQKDQFEKEMAEAITRTNELIAAKKEEHDLNKAAIGALGFN